MWRLVGWTVSTRFWSCASNTLRFTPLSLYHLVEGEREHNWWTLSQHGQGIYSQQLGESTFTKARGDCGLSVREIDQRKSLHPQGGRTLEFSILVSCKRDCHCILSGQVINRFWDINKITKYGFSPGKWVWIRHILIEWQSRLEGQNGQTPAAVSYISLFPMTSSFTLQLHIKWMNISWPPYSSIHCTPMSASGSLYWLEIRQHCSTVTPMPLPDCPAIFVVSILLVFQASF